MARLDSELDEYDDDDDEVYLWMADRHRCRDEEGVGTDIIVELPLRTQRSSSAPPPSVSAPPLFKNYIDTKGGIPYLKAMLAAPAVDLTFDDDDWVPSASPRLYRAASVGNSWGVTSMGRGFNWKKKSDGSSPARDHERPNHVDPISKEGHSWSYNSYSSKFAHDHPPQHDSSPPPSPTMDSPASLAAPLPLRGSFIAGPLFRSPIQSPSASPRPQTPIDTVDAANGSSSTMVPSSPRPGQRSRRRSSQQRVSLIAGRVSIIPVEPPSPPPISPQKLIRTNSAASFLSVASSVEPPPPDAHPSDMLGQRSISEFVIEREIGRGAYGLVKRARSFNADGTLGPPLVIKQIIKSRILADCWKRHPKYGTIPIEIYVMSAISSTNYVLPPRRPWDPSRLYPEPDDSWVEGKVVHGHPNICPLFDFFEDNHFYYLVLPCTAPEPKPDEPSPPSDLFELVEGYPHGLPPSSIRSYLGQIADALVFLHSKGIVHRDIKDENVVLGQRGKCVLIDFGSSGLVKKGGWDTFSGTLDYAGPEILRGERYQGKEQDVWAFGVVAYVMIVGECPFTTAAEAQDGLESPFANASIALDERCTEGKEKEGEEADGGGALGDAAALVRACLQVEVSARPTFEKILESRFLSGHGGWGLE